jgi:uncharacterized Zn finger protein
MEVSEKGVEAVVQGSRPEPYKVTIRFTRLSDAEWERVIDAMASQAIYAARLLSGEMPEDIEDLFTAAGASLFPREQEDMQTHCSCPDWANPCKHIAAVHYLLGERFDEDPFLMFLLRGRSQSEIVAALRARRGGSRETTAEPVEAGAAAPPDLLTFWRTPEQTEEVALHFALPESHALPVKRLGPARFVRDQSAFSGAMERVYAHISEYALLLALGDT